MPILIVGNRPGRGGEDPVQHRAAADRGGAPELRQREAQIQLRPSHAKYVEPLTRQEPPPLLTLHAVVDCTQEEMYEACARELVQDVTRGYNGTIFA